MKYLSTDILQALSGAGMVTLLGGFVIIAYYLGTGACLMSLFASAVIVPACEAEVQHRRQCASCAYYAKRMMAERNYRLP